MDNIEKKLEIIIKLIDTIPQGECKVVWQDKTVIKIEEIKTKAVVTK